MVASAAVLVDRARSQTGLTDLGDGPWALGLEQLVEAVDRDLHGDAEAAARIEDLVVERLVLRIRIEDWYARHGSEADAAVEGPLVILGLPRTATTALHHLLANDPQFRYPRAWELKDPVPPPDAATERDDPRRPAAVEPDVRHIVAVDGPAEDWPIHALAFDHAELALPVPSYSEWWRSRDHAGLLPYHDRVLRLLHSSRPPHAWLLKMPAYVFLLPEVVAHYPSACFVMTHRDPVTALASTCSTVADSRQKRTPSWRPGPGFGREQLAHWAEGVRRAVAARAVIGEHRFVDVAQRDLEADPVGTAERIYDRAGLTLDGGVADAMGAWASANGRGSRGVHRYDLGDYGLAPAEVRDAFASYLDDYAELCSAAP